MVQRLAVLSVLWLLLSGCASAGNCAGWSAVKPSRADKLTDGTESQILKHNRHGKQQGCW